MIEYTNHSGDTYRSGLFEDTLSSLKYVKYNAKILRSGENCLCGTVPTKI